MYEFHKLNCFLSYTLQEHFLRREHAALFWPIFSNALASVAHDGIPLSSTLSLRFSQAVIQFCKQLAVMLLSSTSISLSVSLYRPKCRPRRFHDVLSKFTASNIFKILAKSFGPTQKKFLMYFMHRNLLTHSISHHRRLKDLQSLS